MESLTALAMLALGLLLVAMEGTSSPERTRHVLYPGRESMDYRRGILLYPEGFSDKGSYGSEMDFRSVAFQSKEPTPTRTRASLRGVEPQPSTNTVAQEIHHVVHLPDGKTLSVQPEAVKSTPSGQKPELATAESYPPTGGKHYYSYYAPTYATQPAATPSPQTYYATAYPNYYPGVQASYAPAYPNYAPTVAASPSSQTYYGAAYPNYYPGVQASYAPAYPNYAPTVSATPIVASQYAPGYPSYGAVIPATYPVPSVPAHAHYPPGYPYYGLPASVAPPPRQPSYEDWYYYMMTQSWPPQGYRPSRPSYRPPYRKPIKEINGWYADYYGYRPYGGPGGYAVSSTSEADGYEGYGRPSNYRKPYYNYYGNYGMPGGYAGIGGPYGWQHDGYNRFRMRPPYPRPHKHNDDDDDDDDDDENNYGHHEYPWDKRSESDRYINLLKKFATPGGLVQDPATL